MNLDYEFLQGNYKSNPKQSRLIQIQVVKCNKNDPIFRDVSHCANDDDFNDFIKNNIFFYVNDNYMDYTFQDITKTHKKAEQMVHYSHLTQDYKENKYSSTHLKLEMNHV